MSAPAHLTVTSGPDRGRVFDLGEDLVHIGSGPENHVVLSDPTVAEHQASIVSRNGRYAIYTPESGSVDVDGDAIPADQWVWLPEEARIRIGQRTAVQFAAPSHGAAAPSAAASTDMVSTGKGSSPTPAPQQNPTKQPHRKRPAAKPASGPVDPFADEAEEGDEADSEPQESPSQAGNRKGKRRRPRAEGPREPKGERRQVAQFVTDQSGDTVVTLGEDGQLPELQLREGARAKERRKAEVARPEGSSPVLYVVLAISLIATLGLMFLDFSPGQSSQREKRDARFELRNYIGDEESPPEPYQARIREAILAHERGDWQAEKDAYYEVLDLLNAEDNNDLLGLTGNPQRDKSLREHIGILLSR